jgi:outer membrane protein assembly factor BamB
MLVALALIAGGVIWFINTRTPYFFANLMAGGFARIDQTFNAQVDGIDLLKSPVDISVDDRNNVYVLDGDRQMVVRFDQDGTYLNSWRIESKNKNIRALVADRAGGVFVVSGDLTRYDASTGAMLGTGGVPDIFGVGDLCLLPDGSLVGYANGTVDSLVHLDASGAEIGRQQRPISEHSSDNPPVAWQARLAAGKDGSVYLLSTSYMNEAVYVYSPDLNYRLSFGTTGDAEGELDSPSAIAVDSKGRIYVADWKGVQVFDAKGKYIGIIRLPFRGLADGLAFNNRDELYLVSRGQTKVYKFVLNEP